MLSDIIINTSFHWSQLLQPQFYIEHGGLWLILFVIFAETGLFVGFFLPGDSLLFVAGIYSANIANEIFPTGNEYMDLMVLLVLIAAAGIAGNTVGYWFGKRVGPSMYGWKENLLFKQRYLKEAHDFYEKHGGGAIVIARFIPIVRTFAPIVAGIVQMDRKKFLFFNMIGSIAWVFSMLFSGHFLQKWIFAEYGFDLKQHLEVIVLGIVLVTSGPVMIRLLFRKKKNAAD